MQHAAADFNGPGPHISSMDVDDFGEDEDWPLVHTPKALRKIVEQSNDSRMKSPHTWSCERSAPYEHVLPTTMSEPKWTADAIWYTDGSAIKDPARKIGAGVFCAEANVSRRIQCCGVGPTNTITRAELCALLQSLKEVEDTEE